MLKISAGVITASVGLSLVGCGGTQATDMSGYNASSSGRSLDTNNVSSGTSFGAATLGSKLIPVMGKPAFVVGMTVASFGGQPSREFGKNPLEPNADPWYNSKAVGSSLKDISVLGCNAIRVCLFNKLDGLKLDSNGLVTGLDETFVKNMSDMLSKAETNKVQVYVCLSSSFIGQSTAKDPVTDAAARTAYLKKAVTPIVGQLRGRASVFAIDVLDEMESEVAGKDGNLTDKGATWDQARDFIKATIAIVKSIDPQRLVTSSSGQHGWKNIQSGKFSKLDLDFYDFHVYDDKGNLPAAKDLKVDRPILIGSCGQDSKKSDNDVQAKADMAFLGNALKQGYAGALLSDYGRDPENVQSLMDKEGKPRPVIAQLQSFVANLAMNATTK